MSLTYSHNAVLETQETIFCRNVYKVKQMNKGVTVHAQVADLESWGNR